MPFDPDGFLNIARQLWAGLPSDEREAVDRTAVGRLYYGAFLKIRRQLRERGIRATTFGSVHRALTSEITTLRLGRQLEQLHALRNKADYDDTNTFGPAEVARARRLPLVIIFEMGSSW